MELARSTKGANASFITHRCYYARAGTILLRSVELKLYAERPYMKGALVARAELLELPSPGPSEALYKDNNFL